MCLELFVRLKDGPICPALKFIRTCLHRAAACQLAETTVMLPRKTFLWVVT